MPIPLPIGRFYSPQQELPVQKNRLSFFGIALHPTTRKHTQMAKSLVWISEIYALFLVKAQTPF